METHIKTDRDKVNAWLDSIGETDKACRDEILDACAKGAEIDGVMVPAAEFRRFYVGKYVLP